MRTSLTSRAGMVTLISVALLGSAIACGGDADSGDDGAPRATGGGGNGGADASGGRTDVTGGRTGGGGANGGEESGGHPPGGAPSGGATTGGLATAGTAGSQASTGGSESGGATTGGHADGGSESGGATTGGATTGGGSESGGATTGGGSESGGATTGGEVPGGTSPGGAPTGGTGEGGAATAGAAGAALGGAGGSLGGAGGVAGGMTGCYVAVRLDDCCSAPFAASALAGPGPCVVPYQDFFVREDLAGCPAAEACMMLDCTWLDPPSRVVAPDEAGVCEFVDECDPSDIDCLVATDHNHCCACPEVLPHAVVATDPCVTEGGAPPPADATCADCSTVDCPPCSNQLLIPACGYYGDPPLGRCVAAVR